MDYRQQIFNLLDKEKNRQENEIDLIASENYVSSDVLKALNYDYESIKNRVINILNEE